ncbi:kinase-like protein [Hypoxylon sp. FL1857]|nr:kinase-like protein [Hypoxylon sp. FL1857]
MEFKIGSMPIKINRGKRRAQAYDRFKHYRAGEAWDKEKRKKQRWGLPELPLEGNAFIDQSRLNRQTLVEYRKRAASQKTDITKTPVRPLQTRSENARAGYLRVRNGFGVKQKFRFKKVLGWGGCGLAMHFEELDDRGKQLRQVAVKMLLKTDTPDAKRWLEQERDMLRKFQGAEHIVQIIDLPGDEFVPNPPNQEPTREQLRRDQARAELDRQDRGLVPGEEIGPFDAIVMELVPNGDLYQFICKVRENRNPIPNHILWEFFLCLIRGCIGMAYPPALMPENRFHAWPIRETVPEGRADNPGRIVHFDLDPKNVFLSETELLIGDEVEHNGIPVLQIGDFGLAEEIKAGQEDWYYEKHRERGKFGYYCPEQFCNDWDYIKPDSNTVKDHPVAGNYAHHTNIFQIGLIMEALITLCMPAFPPVPIWSQLMPPQGKAEYVTYGYHLEHELFNYADPELRQLVCRCQAHIPADRPSLAELENIAINALKQPCYTGIRSQETTAWVKNIIFDAQEPGPPLEAFPEIPGIGARRAVVLDPEVRPAPEALPRPPGTVDIYGNYYPPPFGGPAYPAYMPMTPMAPPAYPNVPRLYPEDILVPYIMPIEEPTVVPAGSVTPTPRLNLGMPRVSDDDQGTTVDELLRAHQPDQ